MEENQRLGERMLAETQRWSPDIPNWNQFVRDHKTYIKERSQLTQFEPEYLVRFRYRPEEFFVAQEGYVQATWIFLLINDIRNPVEFTEAKTQYFLFNFDVISDLWDIYRSAENSKDVIADEP